VTATSCRGMLSVPAIWFGTAIGSLQN
jgi:hypothetical protein